MTTPRQPQLDSWGFADESFTASPELLAWLADRLGPADPFSRFAAAEWRPPEPAALPDLECDVGSDALDRLRHARGRGLSDLLRLRSGTLPALPDAVARPADIAELEGLLHTASARGLRVVPWGGGTSVTGGVNAVPGEAPLLSVDLAGLSGLVEIDTVSGLATFGAGTTGPAIESALEKEGFTLGHFPQSWELSTLGGWIATRSSGQESLRYGRIEDLVAGLELVAPAGRLSLPALPASAAGPDLRHLVMGSEGRLGVITRATVRVHPRPASMRVEAVLLRDWTEGLEAARDLVQEGVALSLLRLSDAPETATAMRVGLGKSRFAPLVRAFLGLRGLRFGEGETGACLLLLGAAGDDVEVAAAFERARTILRRHRPAWLGARPGRHWQRDRFRHPYLRDDLLDHGYATDTFETAAPWSKLGEIYRAVRAALQPAVRGEEREVPVLCHLSHPYRDGASLYFTFFFRCPCAADVAIARWAELKRLATAAVVEAGGTLSHHHGVGSWHAPWYPQEVGETGLAILRRAAAELDPERTINAHVLLDAEDRLEI